VVLLLKATLEVTLLDSLTQAVVEVLPEQEVVPQEVLQQVLFPLGQVLQLLV
jgi:hypothetical protein